MSESSHPVGLLIVKHQPRDLTFVIDRVNLKMTKTPLVLPGRLATGHPLNPTLWAGPKWATDPT